MSHKPGTVLLNKYRIEALVGQGAFGEVYHVTHLRLDAPRAIKVLRKDMPGVSSRMFETARERFDFEARLGARLDHPNVIKVHDFEVAEGELYLIMEYAPGGSLQDCLDLDQLLSVDEAVRLWRVSDGKQLRILKGHTNIVTSIAFSPDGEMLVY